MPTGQPPRCRWSRGPRAGSPGSGARRSGSGTWLAAPVRLLLWLQLHGEREGPRWLPGVLPSGRAGHERTLVLCAESQPQACRAQGTAFCVHSCLIPGPWCPRPPSLPDPLQETQGTVVNFAPKRGRDRRRMSPLLRRPSQTARRRGPQGLNHSATAELPTLPGKGVPATLGGWTPVGRGSQLPAVARAPLCHVPPLRGGFTKPRNRPDGAPGFPTGRAARLLPGPTECQP